MGELEGTSAVVTGETPLYDRGEELVEEPAAPRAHRELRQGGAVVRRHPAMDRDRLRRAAIRGEDPGLVRVEARVEQTGELTERREALRLSVPRQELR